VVPSSASLEPKTPRLPDIMVALFESAPQERARRSGVRAVAPMDCDAGTGLR
jgi:hypothetical protein